MKKLNEFSALLNEEIDEHLLKEALEKSKHNCNNCKHYTPHMVKSNEYYTSYEDRCYNIRLISQLNEALQNVKSKFPKMVSTFSDMKVISNKDLLCSFFESRNTEVK